LEQLVEKCVVRNSDKMQVLLAGEVERMAAVRRGKEAQALRSRALKYNLSVAEHQTLLQRQGGVCAVCFAAPMGENLAIDHCHTTGMIRGLLCRRCNTMLGFAQDSTVTLWAAAEYLEVARARYSRVTPEEFQLAREER